MVGENRGRTAAFDVPSSAPAPAAGACPLLAVEHLSVSFSMYDAAISGGPGARGKIASYYSAGRRTHRVVDDLSLSVLGSEVLAVVGASGSGKSLLADALIGLYEPNVEVAGSISFKGESLDAEGLARLRGRGISLVPQSVAYLDPLQKVGRQVRRFRSARDAGGRLSRAGRRAERERRRARQQELFRAYGLAPEVEEMYPHELSGGMARRVLLMCALMDEPELIVADEPTPGLDLDLAVQALDDLRAFADKGGGVLLITHDIELALRVADRVAVFRDGRVVEEAPVASFDDPAKLRDPYSRALWHAMPEHGFEVDGGGGA